jgi:heparan-alpha-glucosaminide N-acetyltransferase
MLGALVVASLGCTAGHLMVASKFVPPYTRLWTAPFDLGIGAIGVAGLAVAKGRNSLLLYFGSSLLVIVMLAHGGAPSWAEQVIRAVTVHGWSQAGFIVVNVLGWAALAWLLHWRRIYLRP